MYIKYTIKITLYVHNVNIGKMHKLYVHKVCDHFSILYRIYKKRSVIMKFNQNEYQKVYRKENLERLSIDVKKGKREEIKNYAKNQNKSISEYVKNLITEDSKIEL